MADKKKELQDRLDQIDREFDADMKVYDPHKALDDVRVTGEGSLLWGDQEATDVIGPYEKQAKKIIKKMLDNKDDVLVRDVIDEFSSDYKRDYKSKYGAMYKEKFMPVHTAVYMLAQDMVRHDVEMGAVEPSELTDAFLNVDTYGRPRMNYNKLREALKGLPDDGR